MIRRDVVADATICSPTRCARVRRAVIDTGAQRTVVPYAVAHAAGLVLPSTPTTPVIRTASGDAVQGARVRARVRVRRWRDADLDISVVSRGTEMLIGMDYLRAAGCVVDAARRTLRCATTAPKRRRRR
jgi:predicted aspartyl protease